MENRLITYNAKESNARMNDEEGMAGMPAERQNCLF